MNCKTTLQANGGHRQIRTHTDTQRSTEQTSSTEKCDLYSQSFTPNV